MEFVIVSWSLFLCVIHTHLSRSFFIYVRVNQVYVAIDDRLTSLKTDTFSKTREEKMEDLFAQKDVGFYVCVCVWLISVLQGCLDCSCVCVFRWKRQNCAAGLKSFKRDCRLVVKFLLSSCRRLWNHWWWRNRVCVRCCSTGTAGPPRLHGVISFKWWQQCQEYFMCVFLWWISWFCSQAAGIIPTGERQETSVSSPKPRQAQTDCPWWWQGQ